METRKRTPHWRIMNVRDIIVKVRWNVLDSLYLLFFLFLVLGFSFCFLMNLFFYDSRMDFFFVLFPLKPIIHRAIRSMLHGLLQHYTAQLKAKTHYRSYLHHSLAQWVL